MSGCALDKDRFSANQPPQLVQMFLINFTEIWRHCLRFLKTAFKRSASSSCSLITTKYSTLHHLNLFDGLKSRKSDTEEKSRPRSTLRGSLVIKLTRPTTVSPTNCGGNVFYEQNIIPFLLKQLLARVAQRREVDAFDNKQNYRYTQLWVWILYQQWQISIIFPPTAERDLQILFETRKRIARILLPIYQATILLILTPLNLSISSSSCKTSRFREFFPTATHHPASHWMY